MSVQRSSLQRFREGHEAGQGAAIWVEAARTAARQGDREEAKRLLGAALEVDPRCVDALLGLAWLAEDRSEREARLKGVLEIEPGNTQARAELERMQPPPLVPLADVRGSGARGSRQYWLWGLAAIVAVLLVLVLLFWGTINRSLASFLPTSMPTATPLPTLPPAQIASQFVPQLQAALFGENWDRALQIVTVMQGLDSTDVRVRDWALATHMQYGRSLVRTKQPEQALLQFEEAMAVAPLDPQARLWKGATQTYLAGQAAVEVGDWEAAIKSFTFVRSQVPDFGDVSSALAQAYLHLGQQALDASEWTSAIESLTKARDLAPEDNRVVDALALAYRKRGIEFAAFTAKDKLQQARADLEMALSLRPEDAEAKTYLDKVMYKLFPPKRIEIDISEQRMYVWEGDTLVWKYVVSTGLPGRDTAAGHYKVLDKIPMAYSSVWRLTMPYWLGIYYVGGIENGIHALPIRPDGSVMWAGLLGQKASYGCIILNNQAAKALYAWAEIGTKVDIHY